MANNETGNLKKSISKKSLTVFSTKCLTSAFGPIIDNSTGRNKRPSNRPKTTRHNNTRKKYIAKLETVKEK